MDPALDQVRQELADIHDKLLALPADAFASRVDLRDRQNRLRALSHKLLAEKPLHDAEVLKAAYVRLQEVRDNLVAARAEARPPGDNARRGLAAAVNDAIDSGAGKAEIRALLEEILEHLDGPD